MTPQAVVTASLHRMECVGCKRTFLTQLRNVTFHRSADKLKVWFEAACLHCGAANPLNREEAKQSVDAEVLKRAFEKYHWESPTV
ncbi:MAG: hypothetical protein Q7R85_01130 [bacterium]|nr:hypothetical protein [bacterium]